MRQDDRITIFYSLSSEQKTVQSILPSPWKAKSSHEWNLINVLSIIWNNTSHPASATLTSYLPPFHPRNSPEKAYTNFHHSAQRCLEIDHQQRRKTLPTFSRMIHGKGQLAEKLSQRNARCNMRTGEMIRKRTAARERCSIGTARDGERAGAELILRCAEAEKKKSSPHCSARPLKRSLSLPHCYSRVPRVNYLRPARGRSGEFCEARHLRCPRVRAHGTRPNFFFLSPSRSRLFSSPLSR